MKSKVNHPNQYTMSRLAIVLTILFRSYIAMDNKKKDKGDESPHNAHL